MRYYLTNSDIALAIKNRKLAANGDNLNLRNVIINRGYMLDSLLSNKLRVNRVYNITSSNYQRALSIKSWDAEYVGFACNDIRLFPVIEKIYNSMGIAVNWEIQTLPADKLNLNLLIPSKVPNIKKLLEVTIELADIFFHIKLEKHTRYCGDNCIAKNGGNGNRWVFPNMCTHHILSLKTSCIKQFVNNVEPDNLSFNLNPSIYRTTASIFNNYVRFVPFDNRSTKCLICDSPAIHEGAPFLTTTLCKKCFNTIDWAKFEVYFKNGLVTWENLLITKTKLQQFKNDN